MEDGRDGDHPPRKKSRFFSNGETTLPIHPRNNGDGFPPNQDDQNRSSSSETIEQQPTSPVDSLSDAHKLKQRRKGIIGAQSFGLSPDEQSPPCPQSSVPGSSSQLSDSQSTFLSQSSTAAQPRLLIPPPVVRSDQPHMNGAASNMYARLGPGFTTPVKLSPEEHEKARQYLMRCGIPQDEPASQPKEPRNTHDPFGGFANNKGTVNSSAGNSSHAVNGENTRDVNPKTKRMSPQHHTNNHQLHSAALSTSAAPFQTHNNFSATTSTVPPTQSFSRPSSSLNHLMMDSTMDIDRDATGALLPPHLRWRTTLPITRPSEVRRANHIIVTPANHYTSPQRMEKLADVSFIEDKRKRSGLGMPPPAYVYLHSDDPDFNIFSQGFLMYPELCFALAAQMPLRDLISLYSISKDFHTIIDSRFTTVCLSQAVAKAPQSARIFQFRTYAQYCMVDPVGRLKHPDPAKAAKNIRRKVPSFRWVAFVLHREKVVHELVTIFAEKGCPLPARCTLALKKMWMIMDIPDNARRMALIHNHRLYTELDLYFMMCFFIKLDMVFNDPVGQENFEGTRILVLMHRGGLDTVLKVLKRDLWSRQSDFILAWVKTTMNLQSGDFDPVPSVFGVPWDQVGLGKFEYWGIKGKRDENGKDRPYLLRPDQLVMREAIRRGVTFNKHFLRCVSYGYVRPDTLENYEPRKYGRRITDWKDEDYDVDDDLGGLRALAVEDGGDPLLDLGDTSRGSKYTIKKETVSEQERLMREGEIKFMDRMYEISEREHREARKERKREKREAREQAKRGEQGDSGERPEDQL